MLFLCSVKGVLNDVNQLDAGDVDLNSFTEKSD